MTRSHFIEILMILTKYVFDLGGRLTEFSVTVESVTLRFYCSALTTSKASSKVNLLSDDTYKPLELNDRNCVILRTNRARCTLNKKFLNLLNEESIYRESSASFP